MPDFLKSIFSTDGLMAIVVALLLIKIASRPSALRGQSELEAAAQS